MATTTKRRSSAGSLHENTGSATSVVGNTNTNMVGASVRAHTRYCDTVFCQEQNVLDTLGSHRSSPDTKSLGYRNVVCLDRSATTSPNASYRAWGFAPPCIFTQHLPRRAGVLAPRRPICTSSVRRREGVYTSATGILHPYAHCLVGFPCNQRNAPRTWGAAITWSALVADDARVPLDERSP